MAYIKPMWVALSHLILNYLLNYLCDYFCCFISSNCWSFLKSILELYVKDFERNVFKKSYQKKIFFGWEIVPQSQNIVLLTMEVIIRKNSSLLQPRFRLHVNMQIHLIQGATGARKFNLFSKHPIFSLFWLSKIWSCA